MNLKMVDIPKFDEFVTPLLEILDENGEMYTHDATDAVIQNLKQKQTSLFYLLGGLTIISLIF